MSGTAFSRKLGRLHAPPANARTEASEGRASGELVDSTSEDVAPASHVSDAPRHAAGGSVPGRDAARPTLDELRDRIAGVLARGASPHRTPARARPFDEEDVRVAAGASTSTLPFVSEDTPDGPLFLARKRTPIATRFGVAPLHPATTADPTMLALLARDPNLARIDPRTALYLDTETTGLMGGTGTVPFLIGLAYYDAAHESFVVEQMLLRRFGEEGPMLAHLADRIARASAVVTFNGKSFDMPLVRARAVMNRRAPLPVIPELDLLHVARRVHGGWLGSCSLRSVEENVLGHVRFDDVCGSDICAAYFHFVRTGDEYALGGVVEHNLTDVLAMIALVGFYGEPIGTRAAEDGADDGEGTRGRRAEDLTGMAQTLARAGAHDRAASIADLAVERGGGRRAHRVRGDIAKARGDKARAIRDYEAALAAPAQRAGGAGAIDAPPTEEPKIHLALAKLYEHTERSYDKALDLVDRGTAEGSDATAKRRARLVRKLETSARGDAPEAPADEAGRKPGTRRSRGAS